MYYMWVHRYQQMQHGRKRIGTGAVKETHNNSITETRITFEESKGIVFKKDKATILSPV